MEEEEEEEEEKEERGACGVATPCALGRSEKWSTRCAWCTCC
jgi:hypothetical protein